MKRLLTIFFIVALSGLAATAALNYSVDASNIFSRSGVETTLAETLVSHPCIAVTDNFDERLFQKRRIALAKAVPDRAIVTGSSRSMQLSSAALGQAVLNLSVSGASGEDHIALSHAAKSTLHPQRYIFGVDPWVFNANNGQTRWRTLIVECTQAVGAADYEPSPFSWLREQAKWLQLVNWAYTLASLRQLSKPKDVPRFSAVSNDSPLPGVALIRADGSRVYPLEVERQTLGEQDRKVRQYSRPPIYSLGDFRLNNAMFRSLGAHMAKLGAVARVDIFLPPYHPAVYKVVAREYPEVEQVESMLRTFAAQNSIRVYGSYDPLKTGCEPADFYDGMHPKERCIAKIFGDN